MSFEFLYKHSRADAVEMDELERWKLSYKANCECKEAIEKAIREHFDGMYLDSKCVKEVFSEYGYDRTMWVLAATICCKDYDGRFSNSNKEWAKGIITTDISTDEMRRYAVDSHPAVLDGKRVCPDQELLKKMIEVFNLNEEERCIIFDLYEKASGKLSPDIVEYVQSKEIIKRALRAAKAASVTDSDWEMFIDAIKNEQ